MLLEALVLGLFLGLDYIDEALVEVLNNSRQYFVDPDASHKIIKDLESLPNGGKIFSRNDEGRIILTPDLLIKDYFPEAIPIADKMWEEYES